MTIQSSEEFMKICRQQVVKYFNDHVDATDKNEISFEDTYVTYYGKSLQNHKCLISTTVPDGMYYECTYNGDKDELYLDVYKKWENKCISFAEKKASE